MMLSTTIFLALSLQGQTPSFSLAGQEVYVNFPKAPKAAEEDISAWKGWGDLAVSTEQPEGHCWQDGDWSQLEKEYNLAHSKLDTSAPVWKMRFFLLPKVDVLEKGENGFYRQRRSSLETNQISDALKNVARFCAMAEAAGHGAFRVEPELTIDSDPVRFNINAGDEVFRSKFLYDYVEPRINSGEFKADDQVYRGPYQSVFVLQGGLSVSDPKPWMVNGAFASIIDVATDPWSSTGTGLSLQLYRAFAAQIRKSAIEKGFEFASDAECLPSSMPASIWKQLLSKEPITGEKYLANQKVAVSGGEPNVEQMTLLVQGAHSPNVTVKLVNDPDQGMVLEYREKDFVRGGGLTIPFGSAEHPMIDLSQKPFLSFDVKSAALDPIAVWLRNDQGEESAITLGGEGKSAFRPDGAWHTITVDLSQKLSGKIVAMWIAPPPGSSTIERARLEEIVYQFNSFKLNEKGVATAENSKPTTEAQTAATTSDQGLLIALMKSPNDSTRLNATARFVTLKNPKAEEQLAANINNLNPRIAEMALRALANQNTETAWAKVRNALNIGPGDWTKRTAAVLLASKKDPKLAGAISTLMATRSPNTRLGAVEALAQLPGETSQIVLMTFLQEIDPTVRIMVTHLCDSKNEYVARKLLWSAVNDSSDAVRAWSNIKLIESGNAEFQAEGYKGVRDESLAARARVLQYLMDHPAASHRAALQIAVVDPEPMVRALALYAFRTMPGEVKLEEVANTVNDTHPGVKFALEELAKEKKLELPKP